ncbi:MAG: type II toxin-antitoxin system VapC family toxin, partial [Methanosarcinales archaeon]
LIMKRIYGIDSKKASDLLLNLMDSKRIIWWDKISKNIVETGLNYASEYNIDSWDGYLLAIMKQNGIDTIYTIDKDFENIRGITMINPIPKNVMGELSKFLEKS